MTGIKKKKGINIQRNIASLIIDHDQEVGFIPGMQRWFDIHKIKVICHINKRDEKNHDYLSRWLEKKTPDKIHSFMIKILNTLSTEKAHLNIIKGT